MGRDQEMGGGVDCGTGPRDGWGCRLWDGTKGWVVYVDCGRDQGVGGWV